MLVKKLLLTVLILLVIAFIIDLVTGPPVVVYTKEAVFGNLNLVGLEEAKGKQLLQDTIQKPIYLNLTSHSRAVSLKEMGTSMDTSKLKGLTKACPSRIIHIFCKPTTTIQSQPADVLVVDQPALTTYLTELEQELQFLAKNTIVSFEDYTFRAVSPEAKVILNKDSFTDKAKLVSLLSSDQISLKLELTVEDPKNQKLVTEELISNISYPLLIKYGRNPIYIPAETVKTFLSTIQRQNVTLGQINEQPVQNYLNDLHKTYKKGDLVVLDREAVEAIRRAVLFRAADYKINNAVVLPIKGKPRSNGEKHDVYLEVIKSQQRLYRFENGELTKTYIVSTGLTWETPPGEYQIQDKQAMTISYFNDWYMPHYLPIGTVYGYRFGFHAIPYHVDGYGNVYSRDRNTMGSPATGGCIQLTPEDAKELFDWAWVGIPVYVYE